MENDLKAIYDYIAFTLLAPDIAARQLDRIEKAIAKYVLFCFNGGINLNLNSA